MGNIVSYSNYPNPLLVNLFTIALLINLFLLDLELWILKFIFFLHKIHASVIMAQNPPSLDF